MIASGFKPQFVALHKYQAIVGISEFLKQTPNVYSQV